MQPDADSRLLAVVAEATKLREGPEGVAALLRTVLRSGPMPLNELARAVRLPLPVATAVRRELESAGLLERGGGVRLSGAGRRFCETELALASGIASPAATAHADGSAVPPALHAALAAMERHLANAPPPIDVTLDQAPCTAETAVRRAEAMFAAGAVEGRRIALIGDDDSMSVAIPAVAGAFGGPPREIVVFEIDAARCEQLAAAAGHTGAPVRVVRHDLREPLPEACRGRFDLFVTDPPYTLEGMELFVSRGLEAMREEVGLPAFLSYGDLAAPDQLALLRCVTALGLAPTRIRPSFNRYAGASILGSVGQFIELRLGELRTPGEPRRHEGPIYTGEVRPRRRRYRCRACGVVTVVGTGETHATVEALKRDGCPRCGEHTFRREGLVAG
ncbi:bis-aminopropyl spermidine synthase family protein [Aureimonas leprariae]|uniref:Putative methyltransferase n=1 Tax=Plantimonas leprariae TaxID=2615207 RepID=A0A7V7PS24_9HYPH|nr:bis-aminopropyl spermidine synthase family protein [Aureimonas leprariae]KAB0681869.1 putative methyltransferase [Aureimonas leprariae]